MTRPEVIVYAESSVDGRITVAPDVLLLFGDDRWPSAGDTSVALAELRRLHSPQAILEGSGSFVLPGGESDPLPPAGDDAVALCVDTVFEDIPSRPGFRGWFVVVDGGGRIRWYYTGESGREAPGSEGWHLLVLVLHDTSRDYLAYLRREHVPYLVAGERRVDLSLALGKLGSLLGVERVLCTSPGKLGGALLRAGLVDEINVLWLPIVIGGAGTPSLFESPDLGPGERPARLSLVSTETCSGGAVWQRYLVHAEGEAQNDRAAAAD